MLHGVQLISKPNISQNGLIYLARLHVGAGKDLNFHIAAVDSIQALQLIWPVVDSAISGADLSLLWGGGKNLGLLSE